MSTMGVFSTLGDTMSTAGGYHVWRYHEYSGGCLVPWGDTMSTLGDTMMSVGDIISTPGHVQYTWVSIQIQLFSQ